MKRLHKSTLRLKRFPRFVTIGRGETPSSAAILMYLLGMFLDWYMYMLLKS